MARRKERRKHFSLLDDKPVSNIKKEEKREPGLLTKEEIEELHDWLLSLEKDVSDGNGHLSLYVTEDKVFGLGKRGRMSQEEIDELLKYMLEKEY